MKYKITKLDRRYNGYAFYQYMIEPFTRDSAEGPLQFIDVRNWCWATYGPSAELGWTYRDTAWAWDTEYNRKRIYLKSKAELTLFALKFAS